MIRVLSLTSIFLANLMFFSYSSASEGMFSYSYTAETTPAGQWEFEQKNFVRFGKARGNYTAIDNRNEIEYGITDRLQGALYLNSTYLNSSNQYDPENVSQDLPNYNEFDVNGISFELMYRVYSPYIDGWGLAFYLEPELAVRDGMTGQDKIERALEGRVIVQKNFMNDELVTVFNLMLEPEWEREAGVSQKELWLQLSGGAIYRLKSNWFAGLEFRNHMEFPGMDFRNQEHSAYFAGPTLHYGSEAYWWTLTLLPQIVGWPRNLGTGADGKTIDSSYAHLGQHEKFNIAFSFGIPLGSEGHSHAH